MSTLKKEKISKLGLIVWGCCLVYYLYEFFLRTFIGTLAKDIIASLSLSSEQFAVLGSAYYFAYSLMQIPVGYLTEKIGTKRVVISAMFLCALSVFCFAISTTYFQALLSRLLMGFGSSFGFVSLLIVITNWFEHSKQATFIGISQFVGTLGPLIAGGPLVSLLEASDLSWQAVLIRVAVFGALFCLLMLFLFKNRKRSHQSELVVLRKPKSFLMQLQILFKNRQAWMLAFYSALSYETVDFLGAIWGTVYLEARGLPLQTSGYIISLAWLGFACGCPLSTFFSNAIKRRKPILMLFSFIGLISTSLITYTSLPSLFLYQTLFFLVGIASSSLNLGIASIVEHVEISVRALALGFNNGVIILFGAIIPILASLFIHLPKDHSAVPRDFTLGFTILPLMYLVALILSTFFIKETFCKRQKGVVFIRKK